MRRIITESIRVQSKDGRIIGRKIQRPLRKQ